ncbi:hypothetical protein Agub_g57, partial [Astrephomene gubernaculifera]
MFNKSYKKEISAIEDLIKAKVYVNQERCEELRKLKEDLWQPDAELPDEPCTLLCINLSQEILDALGGLPGFTMQIERLSGGQSDPNYKVDRKRFAKLFTGDALRKANTAAVIHQLGSQDDLLTKMDRRVIAMSLLNQLPVLAIATLASPSPATEAPAPVANNAASEDCGNSDPAGDSCCKGDDHDEGKEVKDSGVGVAADASGCGGLHALPAASAASGGTWPVFFIPHADHVGPLKQWLISELPRVRALSSAVRQQLHERLDHLGRINAPLHFLKRASVALVPFGVLTVNFLGVVRLMATMLQLAGMRGDTSANKALGLLGAQNAAMVTGIDSMGDIYSFAVFATVLADLQGMGLVEAAEAMDVVDGLTLGSIGVVTGAVSALGAYLTRPLVVRSATDFLAGLQTMHVLNPAMRRASVKREKKPPKQRGWGRKGKKAADVAAAAADAVTGAAAAGVTKEEAGAEEDRRPSEEDADGCMGTDDSPSDVEEPSAATYAVVAAAGTEEGVTAGGGGLSRAELRQQAAAQRQAAAEAKRAEKEAKAAAKAAAKAERKAARLAEKERRRQEKQEEKERRAAEKAAAAQARAEEKAAAAQRRTEEKAAAAQRRVAARQAKEGLVEQAAQGVKEETVAIAG